MLDFALMLQVKLPVVDKINPQSNKFATGVENKATGDSNLMTALGMYCWIGYSFWNCCLE